MAVIQRPSSRLSDNALAWMVEQATSIPDGVKFGPVYVNDVKVAGTGEAGTPLHIYPRADAVQHCELAGMRDTIELICRLPANLDETRPRLA